MLLRLLAHRTISHPRTVSHAALRKPLQFIVMIVMSVICGTFPHTYRGFYMTVDSWCIRGSSLHRHREKGLPKQLPRCHDGHDAHDGHLRAYSRQGAPSLLRRLSYCFNLPDEPDAQSKEPRTSAIFKATSAVGFV